MSDVRVTAIIPARMGSTRFPGKPLLQVHGLPMVEHVRRRALLCHGFSDVVVATCDEEIRRAVEGFGGRVVWTKATHPGATDRVAEAASMIDCTHVVNVQGDEILVLPEDLDRMVLAIQSRPQGPAWNALAPVESSADLAARSIVKCVVSNSSRVLYCSRDFSRLPVRSPYDPVRVILGILAYERGFLLRLSGLSRTPGELAESIDQNRIVEHDVELWGVSFSKAYPGINEPAEVSIVERILDQDARQKEILEQIIRPAAARLPH